MEWNRVERVVVFGGEWWKGFFVSIWECLLWWFRVKVRVGMVMLLFEFFVM